MKLVHTLTSYTKINSKWLKALTIRHDTIKLLEENIVKPSSDKNCTHFFFRSVSQESRNKAKLNKWDPIKLTSLCTAKETINKMKRQATDW